MRFNLGLNVNWSQSELLLKLKFIFLQQMEKLILIFGLMNIMLISMVHTPGASCVIWTFQDNFLSLEITQYFVSHCNE